MGRNWMLEDDAISFDEEKDATIRRMRDLLAVRMKDAAKRHRHSLGVARTAASLALVYDVDVFSAYAAGLIHDWDKVLTHEELLARAVQYNVSIAGSPSDAIALLHGPVAAVELPQLFGELPSCVFQAVARHTAGAVDMTDLDMVVFVADAIEPMRHGAYADELRALVGKVDLEHLFFSCFSQGISYVISTGRYLYPTAIGSEPILSVDSAGHWQRVMQGHAAANVLPVAAANRIGEERVVPCAENGGQSSKLLFYGSSFLTDETGKILATAPRDKEEILYADYDFAEIRNLRREWGLFRDRRPETYTSIVE